METIWFCLLAFLLTGYAILDGFDLGAGVVHLTAARTAPDRARVLASIAPFWDANEVWLIAAGGTLFCAFPALYAAAFAGFYLPLMLVLWLLMLRGIAIELRGHIDHPMWISLWDAIFGGASALLAFIFGAALGNVIRGVPLNRDGAFFLPLWGPSGGILDWYTSLTGLLALAVLTLHGAHWVRLKTDGPLADATAITARRAWLVTVLLTLAATAATFAIQPQVARSFAERPAGAIFPCLAASGLWWSRRSFAGSSLLIFGLMSSAAFGLFPLTLPALGGPSLSLTVHNAAAPRASLGVALIWWPPAMALTIGYFVLLHRRFAGKLGV